jgi:hypothetical protein
MRFQILASIEIKALELVTQNYTQVLNIFACCNVAPFQL